MGEETANEPVSTTATSPEDEMKNYKVKVDHFDDIHERGTIDAFRDIKKCCQTASCVMVVQKVLLNHPILRIMNTIT